MANSQHSTNLSTRSGGALEALARLRQETMRRITKLSGKGYRQARDCNADAAGQPSGLQRRSRRQVMALMSSAAVFAIETRQVSATAAGTVATRPVPRIVSDSTHLNALIDRYVEKKSILRNLERRKDELNKLELQMMPDPPAALCRRKADVRLFRDTSWLARTNVKIGEPYFGAEIAVFRKFPMMRTREIKIKQNEIGKWVDATTGEELPSCKSNVHHDGHSHWVRECWPLAQARANAIVAAQKQWDDDCEALQERLGLPALEDAIDEAFEELCQAQDEIEEFEMRSMADVILKARFAVDHLDTNELTESSADYFAWEMLRQLAGRMEKIAPPEQTDSAVPCNA
jgi:hypothetical protein